MLRAAFRRWWTVSHINAGWADAIASKLAPTVDRGLVWYW